MDGKYQVANPSSGGVASSNLFNLVTSEDLTYYTWAFHSYLDTYQYNYTTTNNYNHVNLYNYGYGQQYGMYKFLSANGAGDRVLQTYLTDKPYVQNAVNFKDANDNAVSTLSAASARAATSFYVYNSSYKFAMQGNSNAYVITLDDTKTGVELLKNSSSFISSKELNRLKNSSTSDKFCCCLIAFNKGSAAFTSFST